MAGALFIVSAPSGAGKTTVLKQVLKQLPNLTFSVSHTTRQPRISETDCLDYFFVDRACFQEMIGRNAFLEWALVHENYYGTALEPVQEQLKAGNDVILDIDVQGAALVRSAALLPQVSIFIAPPSLAELERRLRGRDTDDATAISRRLKNAQLEMQQMSHYDYLLINDQIDESVISLRSIIVAERAKRRRYPDGSPIDLQVFS